MNLSLLYIDPGTGSALFSIAIGIVTALYFLSRSIYLKIKILLFHKSKNKTKHKYVIYAEDKRYWVFFESILYEFEVRKIDLLYLTSSIDDPVFSSNFNYIKGKYIGKGNKAFAYLNFLSADVVLSTTPDLDVLQWKKSKTVSHYCHLIHAAGGASLYRLFSLDYFDSILLSCENEISEIRYLESIRKLPPKKLVIAGNTYFDICSKKIEQISCNEPRQFTVLVSPSWGPSALFNKYGEKLLDPLVETGWRIILRPHPQSINAEKQMLEKLIERYKNNQNIEWDYNHENIYSLAKSDIMISDFSGIIYDYVFLFNRPVLINLHNLDFRRLDAYYLKEEPYYLDFLRKIGQELDESNFKSIKNTILNLIQDNKFQKSRNDVKNTMWQYKGESGKRIVDFLTNIVTEGNN